jgi:hypothetical protein
MRRLLHPFVLVVSAILVVGYVYTSARHLDFTQEIPRKLLQSQSGPKATP